MFSSKRATGMFYAVSTAVIGVAVGLAILIKGYIIGALIIPGIVLLALWFIRTLRPDSNHYTQRVGTGGGPRLAASADRWRARQRASTLTCMTATAT
jgi:hypothetical protein